MDLLSSVYQQARKLNRKIIFPETQDQRVLDAAKRLSADGILTPVLVNQQLEGCEAVFIDDFSQQDLLVQNYIETRKPRNIPIQEARDFILSPLNFAAAMVAAGLVDGMVAGSEASTTDVLRAALRVVGTSPRFKVISSYFAMILKDRNFGADGVLFFADCAVNPNPKPEELADITIATAESFQRVTGVKPRVAMCSFSTKGSAVHSDVDKVRQAFEIVCQRQPELEVDGELQFDAAVVPEVGAKKSPGSKVAGRANVIVFPDLDSGNICYKAVQRLAGAVAVGPVVQGLKFPVNDLSRGCSADDIYAVAALTCLGS